MFKGLRILQTLLEYQWLSCRQMVVRGNWARVCYMAVGQEVRVKAG